MHFPKDFDEDAKSLIKSLTQHDLSKRFGNLRNGVEDIKNHRFFTGGERHSKALFTQILHMVVVPPYIPKK